MVKTPLNHMEMNWVNFKASTGFDFSCVFRYSKECLHSLKGNIIICGKSTRSRLRCKVVQFRPQ